MTDELNFNEEMTSLSSKLESVTTEDNADFSQQQSDKGQRLKEEVNSITNSYNDKIPMLNLTEKILIIIDTEEEPNSLPFRSGNDTVSVHDMIIRVVDMFIRHKSTINKKHEFALMTVNKRNVELPVNFTNNTHALIGALNEGITESLSEDSEEDKDYSFDLLFNVVYKVICDNIPNVNNFCIRTILIYRQSNTLPSFSLHSNEMEALRTMQRFYFDILYVHDLSGDQCEEIFKHLGSLTKDNGSYILEVGRNAKIIHDHGARLLAHPMQREPFSTIMDENNIVELLKKLKDYGSKK